MRKRQKPGKLRNTSRSSSSLTDEPKLATKRVEQAPFAADADIAEIADTAGDSAAAIDVGMIAGYPVAAAAENSAW